MAKKISFPKRACPKCGKAIHIRAKEHECGWKADAHADTPSAIIRRVVKTKKASRSNDKLTLADIQAVKDIVNKLGAGTVTELVKVLEK